MGHTKAVISNFPLNWPQVLPPVKNLFNQTIHFINLSWETGVVKFVINHIAQMSHGTGGLFDPELGHLGSDAFY